MQYVLQLTILLVALSERIYDIDYHLVPTALVLAFLNKFMRCTVDVQTLYCVGEGTTSRMILYAMRTITTL
jgi:hypothetical protein